MHLHFEYKSDSPNFESHKNVTFKYMLTSDGLVPSMTTDNQSPRSTLTSELGHLLFTFVMKYGDEF